MDAAALITIIAVILIVLALVVYLVAVIRELRKITAGLDVVIGSVGEILPRPSRSRASSRRSTPTSRPAPRCSRACSRRRPDPTTARAWSSRCSRAAARRCSERQGREGEVKNIDVVYTRGAVQLARLGRDSPLGAGGDAGPALRDPLYSSAAARSLYSNPARPAIGARERPRSPTIGSGAPRSTGSVVTRLAAIPRSAARAATGPMPTTTRRRRRRPGRVRRTSPT